MNQHQFHGLTIRFNPWIGCTKVSAGCDNCYADDLDHRWGHDSWGKGKPRRLTSDANWREPLKWNRQAEKEGRQHKVFCASMADVMDDEAPPGARERLWELIDNTPHLIWQLLTKRPHRFMRYLPANRFKHNNVWLGITAENQPMFDARVDHLIEASCYIGCVDFISYEPALGPLSIEKSRPNYIPSWIIFGGESGNQRRPCETKWFDDLLHECKTRETPYEWERTKVFVKQMSARTPAQGKALIPVNLLVQEFPA